MPASRSRTIKSVRRKNKSNPHPFYSDKDVIRLKPKIFNSLRDNEDFVALVCMGRVLNVLEYSNQLIVNPPKSLPETLQSHHKVRTLFNSAGYLAEGLKMAESLRLKYPNDEFFKPLLELFSDTFKGQRDIVRQIRNCAFHLDHEAKATSATLKDLKLPYYDFYSEAKGEINTVYFHLPDIVDFNFLMNELMPNRSDRSAVTELLSTILQFNNVFRKAALIFINGVGNKLNLIN